MNDETTPARQEALARRAHLCAADNCQMLTLDLYCWRHRQPPATADMAETPKGTGKVAATSTKEPRRSIALMRTHETPANTDPSCACARARETPRARAKPPEALSRTPRLPSPVGIAGHPSKLTAGINRKRSTDDENHQAKTAPIP
jgi:hypothetical protein